MKELKGKIILVLAWGILFFQFLSFNGLASTEKNYPSRPVEVIVPWGAGSNADVIARMIAPYLERYFKQPFVVVDKNCSFLERKTGRIKLFILKKGVALCFRKN